MDRQALTCCVALVCRTAVVIVLALMLGCGPPPPPIPAPMPVSKVVAQTLGPNDVFEVRIYGHPELSQAYRVGPDGGILFPLIGQVAVKGKTAGQVASDIRGALAMDYLNSPQVSIFVKEYNSQKVSVFGEVSRPGTFPFADGMNIIQAITMAGGFTNLASKDKINITRVVENREMRLTVEVNAILKGKAKNFGLLPGDIVYVPESIF